MYTGSGNHECKKNDWINSVTILKSHSLWLTLYFVSRGVKGFVKDDEFNPIEGASMKIRGRDVGFQTTKVILDRSWQQEGQLVCRFTQIITAGRAVGR